MSLFTTALKIGDFADRIAKFLAVQLPLEHLQDCVARLQLDDRLYARPLQHIQVYSLDTGVERLAVHYDLQES